jgi:glutamate/tyrosine decarboxylase-like PLP-dependent enzyme
MKQTDDIVQREQASLDISEAEMRKLASGVNDLVIQYFSRISGLPVFPETSGGQTSRQLGTDLPVEAQSVEKLLEDCRAILDGSRHNGHPRFFGYVASPATAPGAFADLIASAVNVNVTSWRSGPAATEIERTVVRWLGSLIGYGDNSPGLLTSGGSMANLTALLIAHRTKSETDVARKGVSNSAPMTIYASDQIHMSIPKAADILGLGREQVRTIESDSNFRLDVRLLRERIVADRENDLKPFCVVASSGTVNTGAVDSLNEVADVAREFGLWFHVDGAYGALGALDKSRGPLFHGLERADSVSLDPHKWLYVPLDAGCLLFRDEARARAAFSYDEADYIKIHEQDEQESFAFWNYGPELSRRFRALKIWVTLRYYGVRRIAAAITEDIALADYLGECIERAEDFELLAPVELSICCFRYLPPSLRAQLQTEQNDGIQSRLDELNSRVMNSIQRGGKAYVSSATLNGKFALRACITNFRTTRADIDATLEIIRAAGKQIEQEVAF